MDIAFPKSVRFGAAASAHEVEGGNEHSDWWHWEQRPGRIRDDEVSAVAAGHYDRYAADFALARRFGHSAHLCTVEWARVEPRPGVVDDEAMQHYADVLTSARRTGLEPYVALQHVTLPKWAADAGGWASAQTVQRFAEHAARVVSALGEQCAQWVPLLDPMHSVMQGYGTGEWPPEHRGFGRGLHRAARHVAAAHLAVWRAIKAIDAKHRVGVSVRVTHSEPLDPDSAWDLRAAWRWDAFAGRRLVKSISRVRRPGDLSAVGEAPAADFVGLAWAGRQEVRFSARRPGSLFAEARPLAEARAAGVGLDGAIAFAASSGLPIVVTGIDLTAPDDATRCVLLLDRLREVRGSMRRGANVQAVFVRSLLDGFAWREGYGVRSGLFHVARDTLARTPNNSAFLYKEVSETGGIRRGSVARLCPGWEPLPDLEEPWPFG